MESSKTIKENEGIFGFWSIPSEFDPTQREWMHVSKNHRIIHYVITASDKKPTPMRLWFFHERDTTYQIQPMLHAEGWTRKMYLEDSRLMIEAEEKTFAFSREQDGIVPNWFKDEVVISHGKMDAREREIS